MTHKVIFIISDSRSGSTYLSQAFHKFFSNVLVLPEIRLDNILTIPKQTKNITVEKIFKQITGSNDLDNIFPNPELIRNISQSLLIYNYDAVVTSIGEHYAKHVGVDFTGFDTVLIKKGNHLNVINDIFESFQDVDVIFLLRDPRAVYFSKKRTSMPRFPQLCMGWKGPFLCSFQWVKFCRIIAGYNIDRDKKIHVVKYEDLINLGPRKITEKLLDQKSDCYSKCMNQKQYFVPYNQKSIHENLSKPPISKRIDIWREHLKIHETIIIEKITLKYLKIHSYDCLNSKITVKMLIYVLFELFLLPFRIINRIFRIYSP